MVFDFGSILVTAVENFLNLLPLKKVHSYEQGVKFSWGKDVALKKKPGIYLFIPFVQSIEIVDTRYDPIDLANMSIETSDNTSITLSGNLVYRIFNARKCLTNIRDEGSLLEKMARGELSRIARKYSYHDIVNGTSSEDKIEKESQKEQRDQKEQKGTLKYLAKTGVGSNRHITHYTGDGNGNYGREVEEIDPEDDIDEEDSGYSEDLEDDIDEEIEPIEQRGTSELEKSVRDTLNKSFRKWGVRIYDFSITDTPKARNIRLLGDTSPLDSEYQ